MIYDDTPVIDITEHLVEQQARKVAARAAGMPALRRLVEAAQNDTGQSRVCGRFLLGLYNGSAFPFNLVELRLLDQALWQDCMAVLAMDQSPRQEVHQLVENGPAIWEELKATWTTERDRRAWEAV